MLIICVAALIMPDNVKSCWLFVYDRIYLRGLFCQCKPTWMKHSVFNRNGLGVATIGTLPSLPNLLIQHHGAVSRQLFKRQISS